MMAHNKINKLNPDNAVC